MTSADPIENRRPPGTISGKWVVLAMFAFAATVTGTLYIYWNLHTAPFRPLQEALGREFKGSHPLVQGGQEKIHKGTPSILRIILRVDFDPNDVDQEVEVQRRTSRIFELAGRHLDLSTYDQLRIHLVWLRPEQRTVKRSMTLELTETGKRAVPTPGNEKKTM